MLEGTDVFDDAVHIDLVHLDGSALLAVTGKIDMETAPLLQKVLAQVSTFKVPVVLDFSGVTFMDSSGSKPC